MKSFSLLTLFLLVVIAVLAVSQFVMMGQLADARAEVDSVRRKYGHIRVENESKTYVSRITDNEQDNDAYRIRVPAGSRYLLHLTDATFEKSDYPDNPIPTKTISLNGWREGADAVLSYSIYWESNAPRVVVHTETEEMFDYVPPGWVNGAGPTEGSHLTTEPQAEFSTDDAIQLMWWREPSTRRGIMLWLEPHTKWEARRAAQKRSRTKP